MPDAGTLVAALRARATALGFDAFGITSAEVPELLGQHLENALDNGYMGDMQWMDATRQRRAAPKNLWPEAKSIIMVGQSYAPSDDPLALLDQPTKGTISVYARNRDYHELIKGRLKELAGLLARQSGAEVKVFVDTAPLQEKPLAELAGLGWQGKHSVLVSRQHGSWLFLGAILTTAVLPPDAPHAENCGTCTNCLDICPTKAFPAPFKLDARRCLAYLNIELKTQIPRQFRAPMGNRIYGCDDCLAVCPWNKFAKATKEAKLISRPEMTAPDLSTFLALTDATFRKLFAGSPVKRLTYPRFLRNILIAVGNSGDKAFLPAIEKRLEDTEPLIRGAAIWALRRLATAKKIATLEARLQPLEPDPEVAMEWSGALTPSMDTTVVNAP